MVLADRINVVEGIIEDIGKGRVPNPFAEMGWGTDLKYNKKAIVRRVVITTAVTAAIVMWMRRNKKSSMV